MYFNGSFDKSTDVIVVGFGDAGAITAMTAHDDGAEVLIIEKQEAHARRPNSRFSGGLFVCPDDADTAYHYMERLYHLNGELHETDPAVIRAWADWTSDNANWLRSIGGECFKAVDFGEHSFIEGYETISIYKPDMGDHPDGIHRGWGYGLFDFLVQQVKDRNIETLYGASAQWLLTNAKGDVIGLRVKDRNGVRNIRASRGVVLTCGGFEFNKWMKLNYLRAYPTHFYGNPENTGDGITMAMEVGADLWHMNSCAARLVARFPQVDYPGGCPVDIWGVEGTAGLRVMQGDLAGKKDAELNACDDVSLPTADTEINASEVPALPGNVFVNRYGERFTNELYRAHTLYYELTNLDSHKLVYPKIPSWWVFDERRRSMGPITPTYFGPTGPLAQIPWSDDNMDEIEKGWILSAPTIKELAVKMDVDADVLVSTIEGYNKACENGEDLDHGRPAATLVPLDNGPFYAVQMWPGGPNTQGGARRGPDGHIMRVNGEPIPGLFSSGEFGSVYGMLYPSGGGNIAECLAFGRIAGHSVAAERV